MRPSQMPVGACLGLIAGALALGILTVGERAVVVHLGAEVVALRWEGDRMEEEARGLRMGLSRLAVPGRPAQTQAKDPWVAQGARTREVIQRARNQRSPVLADAR